MTVWGFGSLGLHSYSKNRMDTAFGGIFKTKTAEHGKKENRVAGKKGGGGENLKGRLRSGDWIHHVEARLGSLVVQCYDAGVKTTVDLDPEVLEIARNIALERKVAIGRVISDVFLKNVRQESSRNRNGVRVIERGESAEPVTLDIVNRLRDER